MLTSISDVTEWVWYFFKIYFPDKISWISALILFSWFLLNTFWTVYNLLSTIRSSPSFSLPLPLYRTEIFPLIRLNFYNPKRVMSNLKFDPYLYILYVSLGATLLKIGNQFDSQVKFKSTLKFGISSSTSNIEFLFCSKNYYFIF